MGTHDEAKLDVKFLAFAKQMNLYLNHFPKHEKFGLSQAIRSKAYEVYGLRADSKPRTAPAECGIKGGAFLHLARAFAKFAGRPFSSRHHVVLDRLGAFL